MTEALAELGGAFVYLLAVFGGAALWCAIVDLVKGWNRE